MALALGSAFIAAGEKSFRRRSMRANLIASGTP
jgi:hypothetical protein